MASIPILSIVLWLPLIAAVIVLFLRNAGDGRAGDCRSALSLLLSVAVGRVSTPRRHCSFRESFDWLPLRHSVPLGVDA